MSWDAFLLVKVFSHGEGRGYFTNFAAVYFSLSRITAAGCTDEIIEGSWKKGSADDLMCDTGQIKNEG